MLLYLTGYVAYLLPVVLGGVAWIALFGMDRDGDGDADLGPALRLVGIVGFLRLRAPACCICASAARRDFSAGSGGILGAAGRRLAVSAASGPSAATCSCSRCCWSSVTLATGLSWFAVMDRIGAGRARDSARWFRRSTPAGRRMAAGARDARGARGSAQGRHRAACQARAGQDRAAGAAADRKERARQARDADPAVPRVGDGSGIPPLSLLDDPKPQAEGLREETLETLSRQIEFKLKDFRIDAQVVGAYPGPVITRFEMEPAPGIKVSQISILDKDIARGLSVKSACAWST